MDSILSMEKKKLPIYEIRLDGEELGVSFVSVVKDPAIEINWHAFSSQEMVVDNVALVVEPQAGESKEDFIGRCMSIETDKYENDQAFAICISKWDNKKFSLGFAKVSEEKRMLAGPLMIPDLKIYRKDETGAEYEVFFSKETIELAIKKFSKGLNGLNINEEHTDLKVPGYVVESWIVADGEDKSKTMGFNLPAGTWFGVIHIEDQAYWDEMVKTKQVRGFSVEGLMSLQKKRDNAMEKFTKATLVGGVEVYTKTETDFAVGDELFVMVDGAEAPAPDGEHQIDGGATLVVMDGKIVEIKAAEEMTEAAPTEETTEVEMTTEEVEVEAAVDPSPGVTVDDDSEVQKLREEMVAVIADLSNRLAAVEAKLAEAEAANAKMSEEVQKMSKFTSEAPTKPKTEKKVTLFTKEIKNSDKLAAFEAVRNARG